MAVFQAVSGSTDPEPERSARAATIGSLRKPAGTGNPPSVEGARLDRSHNERPARAVCQYIIRHERVYEKILELRWICRSEGRARSLSRDMRLCRGIATRFFAAKSIGWVSGRTGLGRVRLWSREAHQVR